MSNENFMRRRRRVRLFWISTITIATLAIGYGLMPRAIEADVALIDSGDIRVDLIDEGRTRMHEVYAVSAPVSGRLLRVEVEPGDSVQKGAVVARMTQASAGFLDTRSDIAARAAVDAGAAALRAADVELALARREDERIRSLAARQLVAASASDSSQARLDAASAARDAQAAELARARSALQPADRRGGASVDIRAPATGRVLSVPQESENVLPAGTPLLLIGDPSRVEVVAEFLSQDAVRMRPGVAARIENWGGAPLAATVERIEPVARLKVSALGVEEQRTNVILQFDDAVAAAPLGHDFRVDARVTIQTVENAVRAPLGALFRHGTGWAVYKLIDGRAVLTSIETGIADAEYREVTAGLMAGDTVILYPGSAIRDTLRVKARVN